MANERDIQWAVQSVEAALAEGNLAAARAGIEELSRLVAVFDGVADSLDDGEGKCRAQGWAEQARAALDGLRERVCELEIDQKEPDFAARVEKRRTRERTAALHKLNRAVEVFQLVAPRIAGLVELAKAGRPLAASDLKDACSASCPHCGAASALGDRFCLACGKPLAALCARCEAPLPTGARFCPACGAPRPEEG